ncbi:MAG: Maf family protein [Smithellaceae bacterium]|nr:Maf family protein [Smithellaceae bacterium]
MSLLLSYPLILASASPRREELLRSLGLSFTILPAHIDETWQEGETPAAHVKRLAREKAAAMAVKHPQAIVLGADTIVALDGLILGKPKNRKQAREMLQRLSGRTHTVFTGFAIAQKSRGAAKTRVVRSAVRFKVIDPDEMRWYIASAEPYDKAGGYAAQGMGASFIKSIRGSYTNVIGLPVCEVMEELKKLDAVHFGGNKR